jgi:hypothetical protein
MILMDKKFASLLSECWLIQKENLSNFTKFKIYLTYS